MKMRNTTDKAIKFQIDGLPGTEPTFFEVGPGETCEVPDGYCMPVDTAGASPLPAIIERIAPGLVLETRVTEPTGMPPADEPMIPRKKAK